MSEEQEKDVKPSNLLDVYLSKTQDEIRPWETTTLPSRGVYYDGLVPGGVVEVRPWGLYADKALSTQRLVRSGQAIDQLFKKHVRLPNNFDHKNLLAEDRTYLLYYMRGITHGNDYEFYLDCPSCGQPNEYEYDLVELYNTVRLPDESLGFEPFKVVLPKASEEVNSEFWVKVRFLRGYDILDLLGANPVEPGRSRAKTAQRKNRAQVMDEIKDRTDDVDETLERNINRVIVEVMGVSDRSKIKKFVERMHSMDIAVVMDFLKDKSPGIDTSIQVECQHNDCRSSFLTQVPITDTFFRPTRTRKPRKTMESHNGAVVSPEKGRTTGSN